MITSGLIYWVTRLDSISCCLNFLFGVTLAAGIGFSIALAFAYYDFIEYHEATDKHVWKTFRKWVVILFSVSILSGAASAFVPSTREACAMIVVPKLANSESLDQVSVAMKDAAIRWLKSIAPAEITNAQE